jgi:hypothetical protein
MEKIATEDFIKEYGIEERIPYFGKARLFSLPKSFLQKNKFYIPKEIFHFITGIYILDDNKKNKYILNINSFKKTFDYEYFSDINYENNARKNILSNPIFLGNNTFIFIEIDNYIETPTDKNMVHFLIEFAKISPDLYMNLHNNNIILISQQYGTEICQFRGNAP